jgi:nucleoside 2-deoxyribosyltransferase
MLRLADTCSTDADRSSASGVLAALASRYGKTMKIYLAGPLFSSAERDFNARLAGLLRQRGIEVWLPQEAEQHAMSPRQIFEEDVRGIDWADVVVANMDGADPDSGTCWECGYAYRKKPIILFRTDFRSGYEVREAGNAGHDPAPYNLMLTESADDRLDLPFKSAEDVATNIAQALGRLDLPLGHPAPPPG